MLTQKEKYIVIRDIFILERDEILFFVMRFRKSEPTYAEDYFYDLCIDDPDEPMVFIVNADIWIKNKIFYRDNKYVYGYVSRLEYGRSWINDEFYFNGQKLSHIVAITISDFNKFSSIIEKNKEEYRRHFEEEQ